MKISKLFAAVAVSMALVPGGAAFAADAAEPAAPHAMNWFGGPVYDGAPALPVTAALVKAGGGAEHFLSRQHWYRCLVRRRSMPKSRS